MTLLQVGDVVSLDDGFGNHWTGGVITIIRTEGIFVRWPDSKIGIFEHRHGKYLKKEAR